ncbi:MAG TPA: glycosyltransferase family 4 protein [Rhizomicrobium sp.]|jgi:glycosyltransferase involved in cell wall biosynthesis
MDIQYQRPLRIAIVVTRDLSERNGRTPILSHVVRALKARHEIKLLHLSALVESRSSIRDIAGALLAWIASVLRMRPLPLQCVLYGSPRQCKDIIAKIAKMQCDAVYLDTVRCQLLLRMLRGAIPGLYVVTDFDDLMSRRANYLFRNRLPFPTGHVSRHVPHWLRVLSEKFLAGPIAGYEALTLPAAENEVIAASDATILLSVADREMLSLRRSVESVHAIPPAVTVMRSPMKDIAPSRFIFIGSDNFVHNRAAIDFLLESWRKVRAPLDLHIYGRQSRTQATVEGVHWHGFVEDLAEVYQPGSVALVPAMDRGGIKTKVLEAWAWGCPALCNKAAMEGLAIESYPLVLPETEWLAILAAPCDREWASAARIGHAFVRDHCSAEGFERAWQKIILPRPRNAVEDETDLAQIGLHIPDRTNTAQAALASRFAES